MTNLDQLKSIYDYAISYTEKGFSVICLKPKSKQPSIPSWKPFTVSKASKEQLESWFKNTANNIGIVTGKTSSIFAIDIDGQEAYNYFFQKIHSLSPADKQLIQSIKDTMKIKTGSGNTNLIFRFDPNEFPIGDELANTILWKDSSSNQQNNHSEIRLKGEGSYIVAPPSIHPDTNNDYTLVNGINPTALSREQINKLIDILNNGNKSYNNSNFHFQNKSHNDQKLEDLEIDEKTIYEIIARVMPYYHEGIRNDFVLYFSGWLRKLGVSYDNAEKLIEALTIDDEERNNRIKTLRETYQKQNLEEVAGYSYLLELLSDQASGSQDTIAKLKEIPKILEAKHIIKKDIKGHKKENNESKKEKKEIVTFKYSQMGKGELYEAVLSGGSLPFFTKYNYGKKEFELVENIEENSRILRPPEREEYPYTPYEFSGLEEINHYKGFILNNNVDRDYLFQKSKSIISKFNNQDDYKLTLIAVDVILSYSQDRFSTIHYDFIVGGNGSGKSSLGDTFGAIAYRAVIMTDPTAPNLFRLLGSVEPAQCTIVLEEADRIDKSPELMAILKTGYARNGRVPKINPNTLEQEFFFSFCQKIIISERSLSQSIAKGVNTRILPINTFKGETKYDIKEVLNPTETGGQQNKELLNELEDFRKLLLVYRLMHFKDPIPDLDIGVEGRDKELVKHLIQLFYSSKCLDEIIESLQKFLDLKNQKKETSLEHALFPIISDVVKFNGPQILFRTFWNTLKENISGKEDEKKPNEYHTEDYGTLYSTTITNLLSDVFGATTKHGRNGNMLIFDPIIIEKLSKKDKTRIIVKELLSNQIQSNGGYSEENQAENKVDQEDYSNIQECEGVKGVSTPSKGVSQIIDEEQDSIEIQNSLLELKDNNSSNNNSTDYQNHQNQIIDSLVLVNGNHKKEKSNSTPFSYAFTPFTPSHAKKSITLIDGEAALFTNPLISKSDLSTGNYDPEIINNIDRVHPHSDRWFCHNCTLRDDKWGMMRHLCKHNKKTKKEKGAI